MANRLVMFQGNQQHLLMILSSFAKWCWWLFGVFDLLDDTASSVYSSLSLFGTFESVTKYIQDKSFQLLYSFVLGLDFFHNNDKFSSRGSASPHLLIIKIIRWMTKTDKISDAEAKKNAKKYFSKAKPISCHLSNGSLIIYTMRIFPWIHSYCSLLRIIFFQYENANIWFCHMIFC